MVWVLALVLAVAGCGGLVWAWARYVEPVLFATRGPGPLRATRERRRPVLLAGEDGHLAFAEALHRAATMNLEECRQRAADRALPVGDIIDVTDR